VEHGQRRVGGGQAKHRHTQQQSPPADSRRRNSANAAAARSFNVAMRGSTIAPALSSAASI
jgi:hypothetical protein